MNREQFRELYREYRRKQALIPSVYRGFNPNWLEDATERLLGDFPKEIRDLAEEQDRLAIKEFQARLNRIIADD